LVAGKKKTRYRERAVLRNQESPPTRGKRDGVTVRMGRKNASRRKGARPDRRKGKIRGPEKKGTAADFERGRVEQVFSMKIWEKQLS